MIGFGLFLDYQFITYFIFCELFDSFFFSIVDYFLQFLITCNHLMIIH